MRRPRMTDDLSPAIRLMYDEISNSFHKVDEFRAKLLGFLPLASMPRLLEFAHGQRPPAARRCVG